MVSSFFLFQAEDGIRDLVRSRGLGDVYKRQVATSTGALGGGNASIAAGGSGRINMKKIRMFAATVSYTHLTLPTSDLV